MKELKGTKYTFCSFIMIAPCVLGILGGVYGASVALKR